MTATHAVDDGFSLPPVCLWRWHGVHQVPAGVGGETQCRCGVEKIAHVL